MKCNSRLILISFFYLFTVIFYSCDEHIPKEPYEIKSIFKIDGMTCSACTGALAAALTQDPRIVRADPNLEHGNCTVYHQKSITRDEIKKIIEDAGFKCLASRG